MKSVVLSKTSILDKLRAVLADEFDLHGEQVVSSARLVEDLDLDSIDQINMAVRLEVETGLATKEEELRSLRTVQDIVDLIYRKLQTGSGNTL
jgi:acyl carrier protein